MMDAGVLSLTTPRSTLQVLPDAVANAEPADYKMHDWFMVLGQARPWLESGVDAMRRQPSAAEVVDVDRLVAAMRNWPVDAGSVKRGDEQLLRETLPRAVSVTSYMRWFDEVVVRRRHARWSPPN